MPLDVNTSLPATTLEDRILRHGFLRPETDFGLSESPTIFDVREFPLGAMENRPEGTSLDAINIIAKSTTHKAIVNADTDHIVGIVSQSYLPLKNQEFYSTIEEAIRIAVPEELMEGIMVRDKVSGGGSWSQREYILPAYAEALVNTQFETKMGMRIVAWNSYDGSASAGLMTGLIDFWCTNGIIVGKIMNKELRRHTTRLTPQTFLPRLRENLGKVHDEIEAVRQMANTPLDENLLLTFLEKNMSGQRAGEMLNRVRAEASLRGETVQAVHAALSYYASHSDDSFQVRNQDPAREARMLRAREDEVHQLMGTKEWAALVAA